jgi:hypothetical protein
MAIYVNGKKRNNDTLTFEQFRLKVEKMVQDKGISIHRDSSLDRELKIAFNSLDYKEAIELYETNADFWG